MFQQLVDSLNTQITQLRALRSPSSGQSIKSSKSLTDDMDRKLAQMVTATETMDKICQEAARERKEKLVTFLEF